MSDTVTADVQPTPAERSLGSEFVRTSAISAAANAAGIVGVLGALVLVNRLTGRKTKHDDIDTDTTLESESTES
jgi:hypothetical protein